MNLQRLLQTDGSTVPLLLRLAVGGVLLPHGLQKAFGLFGGYGFEATVGFFTQTMGLPWIIAVLVVLIESLGALALIAGVLTRPAALGVLAVMIGAVVTVHAPHGFFMNWSGAQGGEGFEYHLLMSAMGVGLVVAGGGRYAVDAWIAERLPASTEAGAAVAEPA
ncbi:MAG: DoxX family protein [Sandaracinaceae bacterium]